MIPKAIYMRTQSQFRYAQLPKDEIPLVLSEFIENALRYIKGENKIENQMKAWDRALILL